MSQHTCNHPIWVRMASEYGIMGVKGYVRPAIAFRQLNILHIGLRGERTLEIAESLRAKVIVPLGNEALDVGGQLAGIVVPVGVQGILTNW